MKPLMQVKSMLKDGSQVCLNANHTGSLPDHVAGIRSDQAEERKQLKRSLGTTLVTLIQPIRPIEARSDRQTE